jgi:hypothetical protein
VLGATIFQFGDLCIFVSHEECRYGYNRSTFSSRRFQFLKFYNGGFLYTQFSLSPFAISHFCVFMQWMVSFWVWPIIVLAYFNGISFAIRSMLMKHVFTTKIFGIQVIIRQLLCLQTSYICKVGTSCHY